MMPAREAPINHTLWSRQSSSHLTPQMLAIFWYFRCGSVAPIHDAYPLMCAEWVSEWVSRVSGAWEPFLLGRSRSKNKFYQVTRYADLIWFNNDRWSLPYFWYLFHMSTICNFWPQLQISRGSADPAFPRPCRVNAASDIIQVISEAETSALEIHSLSGTLSRWKNISALYISFWTTTQNVATWNSKTSFCTLRQRNIQYLVRRTNLDESCTCGECESSSRRCETRRCWTQPLCWTVWTRIPRHSHCTCSRH